MIPTERPTPENTENYAFLLAAGKSSLRASVDGLHDIVKKRTIATHDHIAAGAHGDVSPHDLMQSQLASILEGVAILQVLQPTTYASIEQIVVLLQALVIQTVPAGMRWEDFTARMIQGLDKVREDQIAHIDHPSMESKIVAAEIDRQSRQEKKQ